MLSSLVLRRPPRSPPFPTRRSSDLHRDADALAAAHEVLGLHRELAEEAVELAPAAARSEEHTSELQSQSNLVCRLLLEKKKQSIRLSTPRTPNCARRRVPPPGPAAC